MELPAHQSFCDRRKGMWENKWPGRGVDSSINASSRPQFPDATSASSPRPRTPSTPSPFRSYFVACAAMPSNETSFVPAHSGGLTRLAFTHDGA